MNPAPDPARTHPQQAPADNAPGRGLTLRRASRLTGKNAFAPVFAARLRREAGPMSVRVAPNGLGFHRIGVSTPKKIGNAVVRHRWKRRVREAFRLHRQGWPGSYDVVVLVKPSRRSFGAADVARLLGEAMPRLHATALQQGVAQQPGAAQQQGAAPEASASEPPERRGP